MALQLPAQQPDDLISAVREGLPFEQFAQLRDALELTTEQLSHVLSIPRRTLSKRQKDGKFTLSESNALSRVTRVHQETLRFFEDPDDARRWLKTSLPALEDRTPLSLLDTDPGADAVSVLLRQLAWGLYP